MQVQIMNHAGLNNKNIVNSIGIFNNMSFINSNLKEYCWDEQCIMQLFLGWTV